MTPVHGQTETVLSNYRPQEGPDQLLNRLCLRGNTRLWQARLKVLAF